jgi:hypothetical protein
VWVCVGRVRPSTATRARDRKIKDGASLLALGEVGREAVARCTPRDSVRLEGRVRAHAASSSEGWWLCQGERVRESRQLRDATCVAVPSGLEAGGVPGTATPTPPL